MCVYQILLPRSFFFFSPLFLIEIAVPARDPAPDLLRVLWRRCKMGLVGRLRAADVWWTKIAG